METHKHPRPVTSTPDLQLPGSALVLGEGEMARHIRSYPWAISPLGPVESWPSTLLAMVNLLLNSPLAAAIYWGPDMLFFCNDASLHTLRLEPLAALGLSAQTLWGPEWSQVEDRFQAVLTAGESFVGESTPFLFQRSGRSSEIYVNYSLSPIYHEGKVAGIFRTFHETTDTVLAMRALAESEANLKMALSVGTCVGVWDWHIHTGMVYSDATIASFYGIDPKAAAAGTSNLLYERMLHPDDIVLLADAILACITTGTDFSVDYRVRRPDDSYGWIQSRGRCIYDELGHAVRVTGVKLDVTAQRKTAFEVTSSQDLFSDEQRSSFPAHVTSFVSATANLLAEQPANVSLKVNSGPAETHFILQVNDKDIGNFVGKQGRIIRAIRTLLYTVAVKCQHRFSIDIESNNKPQDRK